MEPKKICFLTQEYKRGATWIYCDNLAKRLMGDSKWDPYVTVADKFNDLTNEPLTKYKLHLLKTSSSKFFYSRSYWKKSRLKVKEIQPDIVHGNMNLLSSYGIKNDYPIIETVHTTFSRERRGAKEEPFNSLTWVEKRVLLTYRILKRIESKLLSRAKHLIAVSQGIKNELTKSYSIDENRITVIPNGVDTSIHHNIKEKLYDKRDDELVLGFLGRMTASKGAKMLLLIMKQLKKKIPKLKLLTAGDDLDTRNEIVSLINEYNLNENIIDYGYIYDNQKKNAFYSSLDILLHPSSHEGMSLVLLEALACQTPVITTVEAATFDHANTMISIPRSVQSFTEKISELYNNQQELENIKKKSFDVAKKYSWENTVNLTKKTYENVLSL
ncbi:MAG: glycosyltransferase family 4 protein [Candidatus Heimdallarchaeaceae archaeon]|jgi:glycosyltransferase involved in cell wall biosynthesis